MRMRIVAVMGMKILKTMTIADRGMDIKAARKNGELVKKCLKKRRRRETLVLIL